MECTYHVFELSASSVKCLEDKEAYINDLDNRRWKD